MLLGNDHTLAQRIMRCFEKHTQLTVKDLHRELCGRFAPCSERAVYKELSKLLDQGVVVKVNQHYSPSLAWILNLMNFSNTLFSRVVGEQSFINNVFSEGGRHRWQFTELLKLDNFLVQLLAGMSQRSNSKILFSWQPYYWYPLISPPREDLFQKALGVLGTQIYIILGRDVYLNRWGQKHGNKQMTWSHAESPFHKDFSRSFVVSDEAILTVKLDNHTDQEIERLFLQVQKQSDLQLHHLNRVFLSKCKATVTFETTQKKVVRLRKQLCRYFGVSGV